MRYVVFAVMAIILPGMSLAGNPTKSDLEKIMLQLQEMDVYSYRTEIRAVFPNGQRDTLRETLHLDRGRKRLWSKNNVRLLVFSEGWLYKADYEHKTVSVLNAEKYNKKYGDYIPDLETVFDHSAMTTLLDSVILKQAILRFSKREGTLSTFRLSFPQGSYLKEMTLVYNHTTQLPESILFKAFYAEGGSGTTYVTRSFDYKRSVSEVLFELGQYFAIRSGKVELKQYKDYKLDAIL